MKLKGKGLVEIILQAVAGGIAGYGVGSVATSMIRGDKTATADNALKEAAPAAGISAAAGYYTAKNRKSPFSVFTGAFAAGSGVAAGLTAAPALPLPDSVKKPLYAPFALHGDPGSVTLSKEQADMVRTVLNSVRGGRTISGSSADPLAGRVAYPPAESVRGIMGDPSDPLK